MTEDEQKIIFYLILGIIGGIALFIYGFRVLRKARLIANIPTSKARSVALGLVEVAGKAKHGEHILMSPFANVPCVFYKYSVEEHRGSGKNSRWVTLAKGDSPQSFYVEDETGRIDVFPHEAELHIQKDHSYRNGLFSEGDRQNFSAGLTRLGIDATSFLGLSKSLRCSEYYIQENDSIYVMGNAQKHPTVQSSPIGADTLCIAKRDSDFFCISDQSEKSLLGTLKLKSHASLVFGPLITLCCLAGMLKILF